MRSVTYSMSVSLDGYIVGPDGGFDWTAPDEEVFRFATDEVRKLGVHLLGRRLYETMLYWETADEDPSLGDSMLEFAAIWKALPKVVFSATLPAVRGNARLASGGLAEEIEWRARDESAGFRWRSGRVGCFRGSVPLLVTFGVSGFGGSERAVLQICRTPGRGDLVSAVP